jgi:phage terminase Nu1 subunit (DNA packaging protein)
MSLKNVEKTQEIKAFFDAFALACIAFAPDGKRLAAAVSDVRGERVVLIWNIPRCILGGALPPQHLASAELERLWEALSDPDPAHAFVALETLSATPGQSIPFLKGRFLPLAAVDTKQVVRWIAQLDDDCFHMREIASNELRLLGESAWPALKDALAKQSSAETRRRLKELLNAPTPTPERLRLLRTLRVLESIGTSDARQLVEVFVQGNPHDPLTQQAKNTLERMRKQEK